MICIKCVYANTKQSNKTISSTLWIIMIYKGKTCASRPCIGQAIRGHNQYPENEDRVEMENSAVKQWWHLPLMSQWPENQYRRTKASTIPSVEQFLDCFRIILFCFSNKRKRDNARIIWECREAVGHKWEFFNFHSKSLRWWALM